MIIYKLTNRVNGKIYIGQTTLTLEERFKSHIYNAKFDKSRVILRAITKYGTENFNKEVLYECSSKEEMNEKEKYFIKYFNSKLPNGYNMTDGGEGAFGYEPTLEERYRHSDWMFNRQVEDETREKLSKLKAKFTFQDIIKILDDCFEEKFLKNIAEKYNCSVITIQRIIGGRYEPSKYFAKEEQEKYFSISSIIKEKRSKKSNCVYIQDSQLEICNSIEISQKIDKYLIKEALIKCCENLQTNEIANSLGLKKNFLIQQILNLRHFSLSELNKNEQLEFNELSKKAKEKRAEISKNNRGSKVNPMLSEEDILKIFDLTMTDIYTNEIAKQFGISRSLINSIANGKYKRIKKLTQKTQQYVNENKNEAVEKRTKITREIQRQNGIEFADKIINVDPLSKGKPSLTSVQVEQILKNCLLNLSTREIASKNNVSEDMIRDIFNGSYCLFKHQPELKEQFKSLLENAKLKRKEVASRLSKEARERGQITIKEKKFKKAS